MERLEPLIESQAVIISRLKVQFLVADPGGLDTSQIYTKVLSESFHDMDALNAFVDKQLLKLKFEGIASEIRYLQGSQFVQI